MEFFKVIIYAFCSILFSTEQKRQKKEKGGYVKTE